MLTKILDKASYLSHHPIPHVVYLFAMLAIGYQVQVIGELDVLCNLLQDIDAEAFAALLDVRSTSLCCVAAEKTNTLADESDQVSQATVCSHSQTKR